MERKRIMSRNGTTIHREVQKLRQSASSNLKCDFKSNVAPLHGLNLSQYQSYSAVELLHSNSPLRIEAKALSNIKETSR